MNPASQTTRLSTPELQAALRLAGLPPSPTSPFAALAPPASLAPEVASSLRHKNVVNAQGTVTDSWRQALAALASPSHRIGVYLGSPDRWFSMAYFLSPLGLIGYSSGPEEYNVTFPTSRNDIEEPLAEWLQWRSAPASNASHSSLSLDELAALAAVVDATREETLRALLERRLPVLDRFSAAQLTVQLDASGASDPRWLASLLAQHAPVACTAPAQLDPGVQALARRGWLRLEPGFAIVAPPLQSIALSLASLNPYAVLDIRNPAGVSTNLIVATGLRSYWALEFAQTAEGPVARLVELGGPAAGQIIAHYLNQLPTPTPVAPAAAWTAPLQSPAPQPPQPQYQPPPQPQYQHQPPPQYQPQPPQPQPQPQLQRTHCLKCGKPLQPGVPFCTGCGTRL